MAYTLPGHILVEDGLPTAMEAPPGYRLKYGWAWPSFFDLQHGEEVRTLRLEFICIEILGWNMLKDAMDWAYDKALREEGEQLHAYAIFEKPIIEISIPEEVCIGAFGQEWCWTPPWAGNILTGYRYILWILSTQWPKPLASASVRPLGPLAILAIFGGIIAVIITIVGVISIATGKITWEQISGEAERILRTPGENVATAIGGFTWPLAAFGMAIAAFGIAFPFVAMKAGITAPVGPARVKAEVGTGAARPPAPPRRR